jgi:hypothetical protein
MSKRVKSQIGILPEYNQNIYKGIKSKTDDLKENAMIKKSLSKVLGVDVDMKLETGETVNVTVSDIVVGETVRDAIERPSTSKLKDLAAITGELKETVDVNVQTPQELFGDIVIKKK